MTFALVVFALLVLSFLLYPFLNNDKSDSSESAPDEAQQEENFRLYQERVADINEAELEDAEKEAMLLELDRELLATTSIDRGLSMGKDATRLPKMIFASLLILLVVGASYSLYQVWGAYNQAKATELLSFSAEAQLKPDEYQELGERLVTAMSNDQDNLEWSYLHGRMLQAEGNYAAAADAYQTLLPKLKTEQIEDRAAVLALVAEMRFFANNQQADESLYQLTKESLALIPNQRQALGLAGILAYELQHYQAAIQHWRALWQQLPQGMESKALENGIYRAVQALQARGETADVSWLQQRVGVQVTIDLADELRSQLNPNTPVFVLAKSPVGPPLPLAVRRLQVAQLPITLFLDDSMAMAEGMNISSVDSVTIIARVSMSGQPVAQPGDWQAQQENVATSNAPPQKLVISEQLN